mmetsp:Transcript_26315/g.65167  ORF Transcript_26315/g.65167 Transcript_26315/m.65167 type:complete len:89 (+) Transcript_26315:94-360(+)
MAEDNTEISYSQLLDAFVAEVSLQQWRIVSSKSRAKVRAQLKKESPKSAVKRFVNGPLLAARKEIAMKTTVKEILVRSKHASLRASYL